MPSNGAFPRRCTSAYALFLAVYAFSSSQRELTGGGSAMLVGLIVESLLFGLFTLGMSETLTLSCVSTAFLAKTLHLPCVLRCLRG